jgi:hypothetical protein
VTSKDGTWFDPAGVRNASVVCLFLGERTCSIALQPGTIAAADARTDSAWAARSAKRDSARAGAVVTVRGTRLRPGRVLHIRGTIRSYDAARRRFPALDVFPNGVWLDPDSCVAVR